jgi:hypothetical protein
LPGRNKAGNYFNHGFLSRTIVVLIHMIVIWSAIMVEIVIVMPFMAVFMVFMHPDAARKGDAGNSSHD